MDVDAMLDRVAKAGTEALKSELRAVSARCDRATGRIEIELTNGCVHGFPPGLVEDLRGVSIDNLADVLVGGCGFNLHFPKVDVDLYVPALVAGIFGTDRWMTRELARVAGTRTSPAKAAAARTNGAKGGRPRKLAQA